MRKHKIIEKFVYFNLEYIFPPLL